MLQQTCQKHLLQDTQITFHMLRLATDVIKTDHATYRVLKVLEQLPSDFYVVCPILPLQGIYCWS